MHEGAALREHLHQCDGEVQESAGLRVLAMKSPRALVGLTSLGILLALSEARAQAPSYQLDAAGNRVISLSNLSPDSCQAAAIAGRVAKREFDPAGIVPTGIVIEDLSGDRNFINIDTRAINSPQISMAARGWIMTGLRTLLNEGQEVRVGIKLCGAAGRVAYLDTVSIAPTSQPNCPSKAVGPSFDCGAKAVGTQPLAQMICNSGELAYWELSYVIAYQALREASSPEQRKAMIEEANSLVIALNDQCSIAKTGALQRPPTAQEVSCIKTHFQDERRSLINRTTGEAREEAVLEPADTIAIQKGLQQKSYLPPSATIDGVLGPVTRSAIISWQRDNGVREFAYGSKALITQLTSASVATSPSQAPTETTSPAAVPSPPLALSVDRSGKTSSIKLVLREGQGLRPEEVFERVGSAVYVVKTSEALGSAVAISDRELLTNCHVVGLNPTVTIEREGALLPATVASANRDADRCILRLSNIVEPLPKWVRVRPYADVKIGEPVFTIGAPQGLELSLADGIVSSKRPIDEGQLIQTSAPISKGSSGGGLFDAEGNLVGITTFMLKDAQNLNFAIAAEEYAK